MEWLVRAHGLALRKAKIVIEKAVKYSEEEGGREVSFRSLKKALQEMRISIPITRASAVMLQRPDRILTHTRSIGTPSEKRVREHLVSLEGRIKEDKAWCAHQRKGIAKAKALVLSMEKASGV
jgi:hypothetical protein